MLARDTSHFLKSISQFDHASMPDIDSKLNARCVGRRNTLPLLIDGTAVLWQYAQ